MFGILNRFKGCSLGRKGTPLKRASAHDVPPRFRQIRAFVIRFHVSDDDILHAALP